MSSSNRCTFQHWAVVQGPYSWQGLFTHALPKAIYQLGVDSNHLYLQLAPELLAPLVSLVINQIVNLTLKI